MMSRRRRSLGRKQHGFVLIALVALLVMGGLYFLVSNLTPEAIETRRQAKTEAALVQAREALIGYALRYRDEEAGQGRPDRMYGYLPLPDLGSSRNNNTDPNCKDASNNPLEGCDANTPTGINCDANNIYPTMIGRLPWRTLGTGPLRDGHGECLWLIVSSLHLRKQCSNPTLPPMNWDTLGQLDIVTANGTSALTSALAVHERPVAIIFSPGSPLPRQNRSNLGGNDVSQCSGNYNAANYLDPAIATTLGGVTNYLAGTNSASGLTGDSDTTNDPDDTQKKSLLVRAKVFKSSSNYLPGGCTVSDCELAANDTGLSITGEMLFGALRKSSYFRTDINAMLDRMSTCLHDKIAAGSSIAAGKIQSDSCYDDTKNPQGYFRHYRDQVFAASGAFSGTVDNLPAPGCSGVLIFAGQRNVGQQRITVADKATVSNYLEDSNVSIFDGSGGLVFSGHGQFARVSSTQTAHQDIVRCIPSGPSGASFTAVQSPALASGGFSQLSAYDPATRTLTLGALDVRSNNGAPAFALYGCAWTPETHLAGTGLRVYFRFKIVDRGDGFVFAMIDGDRNSANVCGAARQQLGYSGNNDPDQSSNGLLPSIVGNETAIVSYPKIGIEFDNTKATGTTTTSGDPLSAGRNDPDYTPPQDNDAHAAIVYWGDEKVIATGTACNSSNQCPYTGSNCNTLGRCPAVRYCNTADQMCYLRPEYDDNVHGIPPPPDASTRPAPRNPPALDPFPNPVYNPPPGLASLDRLGSTTSSDRDFHVRVEVRRTYDGSPADAKVRKGSYKVETWILPESTTLANQITAMKNTTRPMDLLYPGFAATLSNNGIRYDEPRGACVVGVCATGQTCAAGTCYTTGPPIIHDLPMGTCDAQKKCSGPPLLKHSACATGNICPSNQSCGADNFCYDALYSCGSDNVCYGEAFRTMRLGFTNGQGTQDQIINVSDFITTWLP